MFSVVKFDDTIKKEGKMEIIGGAGKEVNFQPLHEFIDLGTCPQKGRQWTHPDPARTRIPAYIP